MERESLITRPADRVSEFGEACLLPIIAVESMVSTQPRCMVVTFPISWMTTEPATAERAKQSMATLEIPETWVTG